MQRSRSRPFRPHCCYCMAVDVELVADRNSLTGAVTLWCEDVCLQAVLAMEMELREVLLEACIADDRRESPGAITFVYIDLKVGDLPLAHVAPGKLWPCGAARDELRLVERRIYQLREEISK